MPVRILLCLFLAALPGAPLQADVLMPGTKPVHHSLVLEGEHPAGVTLVATPVAGLGGVREIVPGEPFSFSSKYGTRIFALKAGEPLPAEPAAVRAAAVASGDIPVREVTAAALANSLAKVVTTLRVAEFAQGRISLAVVGEQRFDSFDHSISDLPLLCTLCAVAASGLLGLVVLARRTRAHSAA